MKYATETTTAAIVVTLMASAACNGTDVGNGIDVDVEVYNQSVTSGSAANGAVDIDDGWISLYSVRLFSGAECDQDLEILIPDGEALNLFDPGTIDALTDVEVPEGGFCRAVVVLDGFSGSLPEGAPESLTGSAIVLSGTRADNTPYVLASDQDESLTLPVPEGMVTGLIVGLDGVDMFAGLAFEDAEVGEDDFIIIGPENNSDILSEFRQNFDDAADVFDDGNGNGQLDDDEV